MIVLNCPRRVGYSWRAIVSAALGLVLFVAVWGVGANRTALATQESASSADSSMLVVQSLVAAFNEKDIDKIMTHFSTDAIYHNMPTGPVQGTEAVRNLVTMFVTPADKIEWEMLNIAQAGSTVLTERIDRFVIQGKAVELPVMGAFAIENGKITAWRDYFDMATWQRQTAQ